MIIKDKRSGKVFHTNIMEYEQIVLGQGNAHLYDIIEDDVPFEIKNLKTERAKRKAEKDKPKNE